MRIAAFYGPVWIIILFDIFIYVRVGFVVFKWRRNLISLDLNRNTPPQAQSDHKPRPTYEVNVVSQVPHARTRSFNSTRPTSQAPSTTSKDPLSPSHARFASIEERFSENPVAAPVNTTVHHRPSQAQPQAKVVDANRATLSYCYTACLFFLALIVTWVPSTINRLYTLIDDSDSPSPFALDFTSSLVLPLQGFWNLVIYVVTSWAACRALWNDSVASCAARRQRHSGALKMQPLGSGNLRPQTGRDPYPLSPRESNQWVRKETHVNGRASDADSETIRERADIVMSLDAHGRVIKQGRGQFDWSNATGSPTSPINALPPDDLRSSYSSRTFAGSQSHSSRNSRRSYGSNQTHSRQTSGHIPEPQRGPSPRT